MTTVWEVDPRIDLEEVSHALQTGIQLRWLKKLRAGGWLKDVPEIPPDAGTTVLEVPPVILVQRGVSR